MDEEDYLCEDCEFKCKNKDVFINHRKSSHESENMKIDEINFFQSKIINLEKKLKEKEEGMKRMLEINEIKIRDLKNKDTLDQNKTDKMKEIVEELTKKLK